MKTVKIIIAAMAVAAIAIFASCQKDNSGNNPGGQGTNTWTLTKFEVGGNLKTVEAEFRSELETLAKNSTGKEGSTVNEQYLEIRNKYIKQVGSPYSCSVTITEYENGKECGFVGGSTSAGM